MREREEVQKMLRSLKRVPFLPVSCLLLAFSAPLPMTSAIFPEQLGGVLHGSIQPVKAPDPTLFDEYGFEAGERTDYGDMTVIAWRFKDSTGGFAAFQASLPADAHPSKLDKLAATSGHITWTAHGNYVFQFQDGIPAQPEYNQLISRLPKLEQSPLPVVSSDLPATGLIPNSERYIMGPVSLEKFDPGIPPSTAAFHMSAEAQFGRYHTADGDLNLAIFNYPTPGIARERAAAFQKVAGAVVKRTGPLVVVTMNPPSPDAAERLLAKVNYNAQLTLTEKPKENVVKNAAQMILSIFKLAGVIIAFCVLSGLAFAGFRVLSRKIGKEDARGEMITLHLERK
jgi:hypothetical protein